MRAIQIQAYAPGQQLAIHEVSIPSISADEVLIKVAAAGLNPVDLYVQQGGFQHPLPLTPGYDVAGIIDQIGQNVTGFKVADPVMAMLGIERPGAFAEFAVAKAEWVAHKPSQLSFAQAAALPLAGLTAYQMIDTENLAANQRILIHAAAGGVGHLAVQIAKERGAVVYGTASTRNIDFMREIGVDFPIDYTQSDFTQMVDEVDIAFDTVGGDTLDRSWQVVKSGGVLPSITTQPMVRRSDVRSYFHIGRPSGADLTALAQLVVAGQLTPEIEAEFPLDRISEAQTRLTTRHVRGKLVLAP